MGCKYKDYREKQAGSTGCFSRITRITCCVSKKLAVVGYFGYRKSDLKGLSTQRERPDYVITFFEKRKSALSL